MRNDLTRTTAERIARRMRADGFECLAGDVQRAWAAGDLPGRESLASRILQEFENEGLQP